MNKKMRLTIISEKFKMSIEGDNEKLESYIDGYTTAKSADIIKRNPNKTVDEMAIFAVAFQEEFVKAIKRFDETGTRQSVMSIIFDLHVEIEN